MDLIFNPVIYLETYLIFNYTKLHYTKNPAVMVNWNKSTSMVDGGGEAGGKVCT